MCIPGMASLCWHVKAERVAVAAHLVAVEAVTTLVAQLQGVRPGFVAIAGF